MWPQMVETIRITPVRSVPAEDRSGVAAARGAQWLRLTASFDSPTLLRNTGWSEAGPAAAPAAFLWAWGEGPAAAAPVR